MKYDEGCGCHTCQDVKTELAQPVAASKPDTYEVINLCPTQFKIEVAILSQTNRVDAIHAVVSELTQAAGGRSGEIFIEDRGGTIVGHWVER